MDVDGRATPSEVDDPQEQETVSEDLEMPDSPPYTDGEAQVVLANDGVKVCLALLLTNEMIAKINQIGTRYRRLELITSTLKGVKREIKSDENILEYKYDALRDTDDQAQLERIKEEMDEIQRRIATATEDAEALEDEIGTLTINLAASRYRCQEILEGTLGRMDLLDIPEPELAREMDPADKPEYVREPAAGDIAASRSCFYDHDEAITQEKLAESIRQAARADLESKREVLITIDEAFEHRQENVAEEKEEYRQRVREGTCSITETEFDLLTLDDFRRMTADLRDAQEAFEESFRKAKQLGALDERDAHYQESVFSNGSQGYPPSTENAMVGSAPTKSITYWRAGVEQSLEGRPGEGTELESSADVKPEAQELEDCDLSSVAISDSWSCVDWSRNRRRIDEWRAIAGRER